MNDVRHLLACLFMFYVPLGEKKSLLCNLNLRGYTACVLHTQIYMAKTNKKGTKTKTTHKKDHNLFSNLTSSAGTECTE